MIISPLLPQIGRDLDIPDSLLGTLVSAYALLVGIFAIVAGPISDKVGRRRILLLGSGIMALALALHAGVVGYRSFLAVRVFAGVAGGVLSGSAVSYIGDYFPYERRGWAMGWVMSGTAAGQILGVPLGVLLAAEAGFRMPFYAFSLMMGITFFLILSRIPQPGVRRTQGRLTLGRAITSYVDLLKRPPIRAAAVAFGIMFLGVSFYVVYLPLWLEQELGATSGAIAALFLVGGVANVITGPNAGRISDRIGRKSIILISCTGLSIVMALTTVVTTSLWVAYPMFFLVMVLVAMRISPFSALISALVEDDRRGSLMSLTVALGQIGFAFGGAVAGPLYERSGYGSNTLLAASSVLAMGVIVWAWIPEPPNRNLQ